MITIRDFMEVIDYRITETSEYGWGCYGSDAHSMDSWSGPDDDRYSVGIVFDRKSQTVYEMAVCDYIANRAYRWIHPDYRGEYNRAAAQHSVPPDEAWDGVNYIDLEVEEDILDKTRAIIAGVEYDTRVSVPVELSDSDLLALAKMAHQRDITLNQLICEILTAEADKVLNEGK